MLESLLERVVDRLLPEPAKANESYEWIRYERQMMRSLKKSCGIYTLQDAMEDITEYQNL